jgi:hypothetical protein
MSKDDRRILLGILLELAFCIGVACVVALLVVHGCKWLGTHLTIGWRP